MARKQGKYGPMKKGMVGEKMPDAEEKGESAAIEKAEGKKGEKAEAFGGKQAAPFGKK